MDAYTPLLHSQGFSAHHLLNASCRSELSDPDSEEPEPDSELECRDDDSLPLSLEPDSELPLPLSLPEPELPEPEEVDEPEDRALMTDDANASDWEREDKSDFISLREREEE